MFYKTITQEIEKHQNVKFKIFSDNILICKEIEEVAPEQAVVEIFEILDKIEELMFTAGALFIRGAVVVGNLHFSENFVYGKALVNAYQLESKLAIYPRVIVDKSALCLIRGKNIPVVQDKDGQYFYDYIQFCIVENKVDWLQKIKTFKFNILLNVSNSSTTLSVLNKMEWAVNYYNENCIRHDLDCLITETELKKSGVNVDKIHLISKM